jgi:hypothetical protein
MRRCGSAGSWRQRASAAYEPLSSLSDLAFDMEDLDFVRVDECVLHAHLTEQEITVERAASQEGVTTPPPVREQLAGRCAEEHEEPLEPPVFAAANAGRTAVKATSVMGKGRRRDEGGLDRDSFQCVVEALSRYTHHADPLSEC